MPAAHSRRPPGITVLVVIGLLQAVPLLALGAVAIALRGDPELQQPLGAGETGVLAVGVLVAALGVLRVGLAVGLARGSEIARSVLGALAVIQVGSSVYALAAPDTPRLATLWPLSWAVVELWLLYGSERTRQFFRR